MPHLVRYTTLLLLGGLLYGQTQSGLVSNSPVAPTRLPPATVKEDYDPLLDLPPLPHNRVSLMGGTITNLDPIQNRLTLRPFGAKQQIRLVFDSRTRFFDNGVAAMQQILKPGQRVYVDTMLDSNNRVFAKTMWLQDASPTGSGRGQVVSYDRGSGVLTLRDELSAHPATFRIGPTTVIRSNNKVPSVADLSPGSLVSVTFGPQQGRNGFASEVQVLARPGAVFTFLGRITYIDLSRKLVAVANQTDDKTYDITVEAIPVSMLRQLREGSEVGVTAVFDGTRYAARTVEISQTGQASSRE
jgi:uncharacterized protein DUF5666